MATATLSPPPSVMSLGHIHRLARTMELATLVGIVTVTALTALVFIIPEWTRNLVLAKLGTAGITLPITPSGRVAAGLVISVPVGVTIYGLVAVRRMFTEFARGEVLTARAARHLQVFAATVLAQSVLGPLTSAGLALALSLSGPFGTPQFMVAFSTNDYFALIVGGVLLAAATIMREATRLAEENARFV
jgi:DUF2975 family protein